MAKKDNLLARCCGPARSSPCPKTPRNQTDDRRRRRTTTDDDDDRRPTTDDDPRRRRPTNRFFPPAPPSFESTHLIQVQDASVRSIDLRVASYEENNRNPCRMFKGYGYIVLSPVVGRSLLVDVVVSHVVVDCRQRVGRCRPSRA